LPFIVDLPIVGFQVPRPSGGLQIILQVVHLQQKTVSEWQGENVVGTDLQTSNIKLYHLPEFFTGSTLQILQTISKISQTSVS
jgi:hypothetical protein